MVSPRSLVWRTALALATAALAACSSGGALTEVTQTATPLPAGSTATPATADSTAAALATAIPAPAVIDQQGDVSAAHLDLLGADAQIDGDRVLAIFYLAGLPEELDSSTLEELDRFLWRVHVRRDAAPGPPMFTVDLTPRLPSAGVFSASGPSISYEPAAFEQSLDANRPPLNAWPAEMELDLEARVVRVAARLPDIDAETQVQVVTYRFVDGQYQPVEGDESPWFKPAAAAFDLGAALPTPERLRAESMPDGSTAYDLSARGLPVRFVVPPHWSLHTNSPTGSAGATPNEQTTAVLELGVRLVDLGAMPDLDSADSVLQRILSETAGAYEAVADAPPFDLPSGFEATALIRVRRTFQVGDERGRVLANWTSSEGASLRVVVAKVGDAALIGYLESTDWPRAEAALPYLSAMAITRN
ncbi:MAG: hypothetical protein WEB13_08955 [Dehalococcoidia bacterium]